MVSASLLRHFLTVGVLGVGAAALFVSRPQFGFFSSPSEVKSASCLGNLSQISRALALYARDFDGKIPLAVDPEDRFNIETWAPDGSDDPRNSYQRYVQTSPFLHVVLRPYLPSPEVFHCPADVGWTVSRLAQRDPMTGALKGLKNVHPSSFAKYGTSYYSWTRYGFDLKVVADVPDPAHRVLLFDGDLWHQIENRQLGGELFLDGHAKLLNRAQHDAATPEPEF